MDVWIINFPQTVSSRRHDSSYSIGEHKDNGQEKEKEPLDLPDYFFDRINRDYKIAQEKCKTVFGPHFAGKMWEPQSLHINNVVSSEAKSIFGTSVDHRFWIGITNDGNFQYESTGVPADWKMPYYSDEYR